MLWLECSYSFSLVPYVYNDVLDDYAVAVLRDAIPEVLDRPMPVDVEWLLDYYLHLSVEFKKLSYGKKVLGMTAFNPGYIQIINEDGQPDALLVDSGTIVIDSSLLRKRNEHRMRFTMMHEGTHWMIHQRAFSKENLLFENQKYENQYLAAKEGCIDYSRNQKERTDSERLERQADFFASAILIPKPTLRMAFVDFFKFYGVKPKAIVRGANAEQDAYAELLPKYISKIFNVSERAATIRLEKLNAIVDKPVWGQII